MLEKSRVIFIVTVQYLAVDFPRKINKINIKEENMKRIALL